jgi:hypothetical protein
VELLIQKGAKRAADLGGQTPLERAKHERRDLDVGLLGALTPLERAQRERLDVVVGLLCEADGIAL